jgi:hypothetical protein
MIALLSALDATFASRGPQEGIMGKHCVSTRKPTEHPMSSIARPAPLVETAVTQAEYWSGLNDQIVLCRVLWDETATNSVMRVLRIGMDTSKHFFQLHGVDYAEWPVPRRKLRRNQVLAFLPSCRQLLSAWRPAAQRITGRGSCANSATR